MKQVVLKMSKLNKAEFIQFMTETVDVLMAYNTTHSNPQIQEFIERLGSDLPQLKESLLIQTGSTLSKKLTEQTKTRTTDYQTLRAGIRFHKHSREAEKVEAYHLLEQLFRQSRFSSRLNQQEVFVILDTLLKKLRQTPYQEAIQLLSLEESLSHLEESHAKAYQLFFQRNQETKNKVKVDYKSIRTNLSQNYRLLQAYLTAQIGLNPHAAEGELLKPLNDIRQTFAKIDRRKTDKSIDLFPSPANVVE